jgi:manganese/zinc/iron transport system permease protein
MIAALFENIPAMIVLTGALVGASAALLGTFLVLRGSAMLSDAISHSIVLGIVLVWLATGAVSGPLQVIGAAVAGVATVVASEALARSRLVAMDAAIGLVFPALFALGVLLINVYARNVHIDVDMVLLGEIAFVWLDTVAVGGFDVPVAVLTLGAMLAVNLGFVLAFYKELKLATFDAALAAALGFLPGVLFYALLGLTSATAVAAFDAVGAILFIAFVVVPPSTALLLTDRLGWMLALAVGLAFAAAAGGYALAMLWDVSISGMMASTTGAFFVLALLFAPRHGILAQEIGRRGRRLDNDCSVLVAHLYSHQDTGAAAEENTAAALEEHLRWAPGHARAVVVRSLDRGLIRREGALLRLTEKGDAVGRAIFEPWTRGGAAAAS